MIAALALTAGAAQAGPTLPAIPAKGEEVQVPPRTPLYCEDGAHTIQPFIYGDFGDLDAAYQRLQRWPQGRVVGNGRRKDGEAYAVLLFSAPHDDPRSPDEQVGFVITAHADGYAIRSAYDQPKAAEGLKMAGAELCLFVQKMFLDSDPARAVAFRKTWGDAHPDSTQR